MTDVIPNGFKVFILLIIKNFHMYLFYFLHYGHMELTNTLTRKNQFCSMSRRTCNLVSSSLANRLLATLTVGSCSFHLNISFLASHYCFLNEYKTKDICLYTKHDLSIHSNFQFLDKESQIHCKKDPFSLAYSI